MTLKVSNLVKCYFFAFIPRPLWWYDYFRCFSFFYLLLLIFLHNFIALFFFDIFRYFLFLCRNYGALEDCQCLNITFLHIVFHTIFLQCKLMTKKEILKFRTKHEKISIKEMKLEVRCAQFKEKSPAKVIYCRLSWFEPKILVEKF